MSAPKERPILFSGPMVRALLDGTKTQTRRVMKPQPPEDAGTLDVGAYHATIIDRYGDEQPGEEEVYGASSWDGEWTARCPFGRPGERLWVRETFTTFDAGPRDDGEDTRGVLYRAEPCYDGCGPGDISWKWTPSIFMPRWASRLTLEITNARAERVQDISELDAIEEGVACQPNPDWKAGDDAWTSARPAVSVYRELWDSLNEKRGYGWDVNPWVWVISFKPVGARSLAGLGGDAQ